jgi:hypothetical protein
MNYTDVEATQTTVISLTFGFKRNLFFVSLSLVQVFIELFPSFGTMFITERNAKEKTPSSYLHKIFKLHTTFSFFSPGQVFFSRLTTRTTTPPPKQGH